MHSSSGVVRGCTAARICGHHVQAGVVPATAGFEVWLHFTSSALRHTPHTVRSVAALLCMQAEAHRQARRPAEPVPLLASCAQLGRSYGAGIGLYFSALQWLQWMFVGLTLTSVGSRTVWCYRDSCDLVDDLQGHHVRDQLWGSMKPDRRHVIAPILPWDTRPTALLTTTAWAFDAYQLQGCVVRVCICIAGAPMVATPIPAGTPGDLPGQAVDLKSTANPCPCATP
jgi:hypothetical protein